MWLYELGGRPRPAGVSAGDDRGEGGARRGRQGGDSTEKNWLEFRLEKRIKIPFQDMSKLPTFEHFLSVGNLKPKLKWFFKPNVKPKIFY